MFHKTYSTWEGLNLVVLNVLIKIHLLKRVKTYRYPCLQATVPLPLQIDVFTPRKLLNTPSNRIQPSGHLERVWSLRIINSLCHIGEKASVHAQQVPANWLYPGLIDFYYWFSGGMEQTNIKLAVVWRLPLMTVFELCKLYTTFYQDVVTW